MLKENFKFILRKDKALTFYNKKYGELMSSVVWPSLYYQQGSS